MPRIILLLLLAIRVLEPLDADAFESGQAPRQGALLLRNGGVLIGQIVPAGDRFIVMVGENSEVRVPVRDVDLHCADLDEVYRRKRARLANDDVTGHLNLADWCLQQKLHSRAADQLLRVIALRPDHPRLAGLERRLRLAVETPEVHQSHEQAPRSLVGLADLEKTSRSLPPGTVEEFTSQIQPLLWNRCAGSSCHGGSTSPSGFRLVRPPGSGALTRRFTQRNLHAVMQWVDPQDADSSPLLTVPSCAHGGLETGVFGPREKDQFDLLANWVRRATATETAPVAEILAESSELPPTGIVQTSYAQPVALPNPAAEAPHALPTARGQNSAQPTQPKPELPGAFAPRDPFDPDVFNRRYHSGR
jgi:hypothetical protein